VNYMDAHSPYLALPPHAGVFAGDDHVRIALMDAETGDSDELVELKRARYDEELHYLDAQLQRLFDRLESDGVMERSWVFITADHGESFREHGATSHGSSIYNEQVRIPLIVKPPRGVRLPATREPVSLIDVGATIAGIAGRSDFGKGHDLRSSERAGHAVAIEFKANFRGADRFGATADDPARAVVRGHWKVVERAGSYELYDVTADPQELANRGSDHEELLQALVADLPAPPSEAAIDSPTATSPPLRAARDDEEGLRSLGYVQ
jgi:arylsulfatase A-like enzyme